jgi:hypothetical protein
MHDFCVMMTVWLGKKNWFKGIENCSLFDWVLRGKVILKESFWKVEEKTKKACPMFCCYWHVVPF